MPNIDPSSKPPIVEEGSEPAVNTPSLHIAVGVIQDPDGNILISQRREGTAGAGLWEFPGGKREAGETIREALTRELQEELGMTVTAARPLIRIRHSYTDCQVLLDTWLVTAWSGEPYGREGQLLEWVLPNELHDYKLLPANGPISHAIQLPNQLLVTPSPRTDAPLFLDSLKKSLAKGLRLVRLRAPELNDAEYEALALVCLPLCQAVGAELIVDRKAVVEAMGAGKKNFHLTAKALMAASERPDYGGWLGASCHSEAELHKAEALGCDYAVLGSVASTATHSNVEPLGWNKVAEMIDGVNLPVYVIGGLGPSHCERAYVAGAQGIAAIRSLWRC